MKQFKALREEAKELDARDPLSDFRNQFHIPPPRHQQESTVYLCGNSLGLQPKNTREFILAELEDWKNLGVEGHFEAQHPWMPYHETLSEPMANVVGAKPEEVVVMNSLTVNLHLLMVSFYRPTARRNKILIESNAFPSDRYAAESQIRYHGYSPEEALLELPSSEGKSYTTPEDIRDYIRRHGDEIALIMIGGVNYYSGQAFPLSDIADWGHEKGCIVGFDLAHGAGNIPCHLHDSGADFACWCSYKYLNSGPGGLSGIFVHQKHHQSNLPRFEGWWGHEKSTRFQMPAHFVPEPSAEAWQLSNPPILAMAALRASLTQFQQAGMDSLREKSKQLTAFFQACIEQLPTDSIDIITPADPNLRGCQLSLRLKGHGKATFQKLQQLDLIADWREPDIIRIAPVPLYNQYAEGVTFAERLALALNL